MRRVLLLFVTAALLLAPAAGAWTWPASGDVLQPFVFDAAHPYAAGQHRGVDIGGAAGSAVTAPAAGTVTFAGSVPSSGLSVTIETADGYSVTLTHLGSIAVAPNASVAEGDTVGSVGPSGEPELPQPYVHLGVRLTAQAQGYVDPASLLPTRAVAAPRAPAPAPSAPAPSVAAPAAAAPVVAPPVVAPAPSAPAPVVAAPASSVAAPTVAAPTVGPRDAQTAPEAADAAPATAALGGLIVLPGATSVPTHPKIDRARPFERAVVSPRGPASPYIAALPARTATTTAAAAAAHAPARAETRQVAATRPVDGSRTRSRVAATWRVSARAGA